MGQKGKTKITVKARINLPVDKVWKFWTGPVHIVKWNNASDDWHTPVAENDLRIGGRFKYRMEAIDGSEGFDFTGIYDEVIINKQIDYTMDDGRKVTNIFSSENNATDVSVTFEAENVYSLERQREGWQSILDNFKKYAESH